MAHEVGGLARFITSFEYNQNIKTKSFVIKSDFKDVATITIPSAERPITPLGRVPLLRMIRKEGSNIYLSASVSLLGLAMQNEVVAIGGIGLALIYILRNYLD